MRRLFERLATLRGSNRVVLVIVTVGAAICCGVILASILQISSILREREAALREYDGLRQQFAPDVQNSEAAGVDINEGFEKKPWEINPDYVGWMQIPGTGVDYPVAQGADNTRYLTTSFEGRQNAAGTIFMDCGVEQGWDSPHIIIYGHNVKNGSMFGSLQWYLEPDYLAKNSTVIVTLQEGITQRWRIFLVQITDAWDAAYQLEFANESEFSNFAMELGAPEDATQLLTLSTCTNGEDDNERMLVHAAPAP